MTPGDAREFQDLAGVRATVLGLAREGTALCRYLARHGAEVQASDLRTAEELGEHLAILEGSHVHLALGGHPDCIFDADVVYVSPGIPPEAPAVRAAKQRGIRLASATELVFERCPAPIVGVTGSSGKTTTATLIGLMLDQSGFTTWVGGNIGRPLVEELDEMAPHHRVVLELSSFQLEALRRSPHIAVMLNLTPDHLDRHAGFEAYVAAKLSILRYQRDADTAVLNADDPRVCSMDDYTKARVLRFTLREGPSPYAGFIQDGDLMIRHRAYEGAICNENDLRLPGRHNAANFLAASLAALEAGARPEVLAEVAGTFGGVPHRLEAIGTKWGLTFVNDSIATSPARSQAALEAFEAPVVLLAGGRDKELPLDDWAVTVRERTVAVVVFGEAAAKLETAITRADPLAKIIRVPSLDDAVSWAVENAPRGAVILLSPACTSFDAFPDYTKRGDRFRALVQALSARRGPRPPD